MGAAEDSEQSRADYKRAWYQRNRERVLAQCRGYGERNREQIAARRRARYRRDRDAIRAQQKRSRDAADPVKVSALRRAAYQRNRERILNAQRAAYARDRAKRLAEAAAYRERNREAIRAKTREYNDRNRAEVNRKNRERARKTYATNSRRREYLRKWQQANPERVRVYRRITCHKRRGASGPGFTTAEWKALLDEHAHRCAYCGAEGATHADHRTPIAKGGRNEISNILPACGRCNRRKHTRTEDEFRALLAAGTWPDYRPSPALGASHSRKASKLKGRPRKSLTSS